MPPCAVKTCAVRPVFARALGELRAADPSNVQGPVKQNVSPGEQSEAPRPRWKPGQERHTGPENQDSQHMLKQPRGYFPEFCLHCCRLEPDTSRPLAGHTRAPRRLQPLGVRGRSKIVRRRVCRWMLFSSYLHRREIHPKKSIQNEEVHLNKFFGQPHPIGRHPDPKVWICTLFLTDFGGRQRNLTVPNGVFQTVFVRLLPVLLFLGVFVSLMFFFLGISLVFLSVFCLFYRVF